MAYPIAAGSVVSPAYSGTFIPSIWSKKILEKFYAATVLAEISNTDYVGEITAQGDKVIVRQDPDIIINDHAMGQEVSYQQPTADVVTLDIDKGKSWAVRCDDVLKVQSDLDLMNRWATVAARQMKIAIERGVFGTIVPTFAAANRGATAGALYGNINLGATGAPLALTKVNIIDHLVDLGEILTQQNIDEQGRFAVIPTWAASLLKKSDLKDASMTGDGVSVMRTGRLGMINDMVLYSSNLLPHVTDGAIASVGNIIAGNKSGLTFATQLTETDTLKSERYFGQLMRGLQVYGFKVMQPNAMASSYVYKG